MGACSSGSSVQQTVITQEAPDCCPVFNPDGTITLGDASGQSRTFLPGNAVPPSLTLDNGILKATLGGLTSSVPIRGDMMVDAFGVPLGYFSL